MQWLQSVMVLKECFQNVSSQEATCIGVPEQEGSFLVLRSAASLASGGARGVATLASSDGLLLSCDGAPKPGLLVKGRLVTAAEPAPHEGAPSGLLLEVAPDCDSKSIMLQNSSVPQNRQKH